EWDADVASKRRLYGTGVPPPPLPPPPPTPPPVPPPTSPGNMVKTFQAYLPNCHRTYSCIHCRAHLANHDELISKVEIIHYVLFF
ncbi:hypothetical protein L9F63_028387, partial [Diploptera punctata]